MTGITASDLAWWIIGLYAAGTVLGWIQDWFGGQYEVARRGFRLRATRRWYGTRARVILRGTEGNGDADRYVVLCRDDEDTAVPWLKVHKLNAEHLRYWDEDAEPFWAPVTVFAPDSVRRVRPHLMRAGRVRVPWLTKWLPMSGAHLGQLLPLSRGAGDELELAPPCRGPLVPGEPFAEPVLEHGGEAGPSGVGDDLDGVLGVASAEDLEVERARSIGHVPQGTRGERG